MNEQEQRDFFEVKRKTDALWSQDPAAQKATLNLQTKIKELETKQLAALQAQAKDVSDLNNELRIVKNNIAALADFVAGLKKQPKVIIKKSQLGDF